MKLIRRILLTLASLALLPLPAAPQSSGGRSPAPEVWPTGTFSILAYDPTTGELGGAVQSRVFSVGKNVFAYTGPKATVWAGNKACTAANTHCTAQGNILAGPAVVDSMVAFFERTPGHLAYRLLAALEGGQLAGGDKRGQESAALVIVKEGRRRLVAQRHRPATPGRRQSGTDQGTAPPRREGRGTRTDPAGAVAISGAFGPAA